MTEIDAPAAPAEATLVFGERLPLAERFAALLADQGSLRGLIGPAEVPRLWTRHLLNCAVLGELIGPGRTVVDVGSGAGLPGLPLAIARPDLRITLVEPLLRRATWLADVVQTLELGQVKVVRGRAEDLRGTVSGQVVTARAVAPLDRLAGWCLPLVQPGGELLAMKGERAGAELVEAESALRRLGAIDWDVVEIGGARLAEATSVVRVKVDSSVGAGESRPAGSANTSTQGRPGTRSARQSRAARRRQGGAR